MSLVMGVDSSTQSCKVIILDPRSGEVVRSGQAPHPPGTEVDPESWYLALLEAIGLAGGIADVTAWSIAGQQHGMVVLDRAGRVIRPALLWNDTRSAQAATDLRAELGTEFLVERTGLVPVASFTITKLRWLQDHEPEAAARVAAVALPHDWLTWRLRGYGPAGRSFHGPALEELVTDRSDASGTGYWNPTTDSYELELLEAALGRRPLVPHVLRPHDWVRDADGRRVGSGAGDNAAAALGLGLLPGEAAISIGTSGTVFAVSAKPVRDPSGTVAGFADATGKFLPIVVTMNASQVLDVFAELLGVDHAEFSRLALDAAPGAEGLRLLPYLAGERTPNLPDATAELTGMTLISATRQNVARSAVEGMLQGLRAGMDTLIAQAGPVSSVRLIGGGARSTAVQHIASEVFDMPVIVPEPAEYVALGAARQATAVAAGGSSSSGRRLI